LAHLARAGRGRRLSADQLEMRQHLKHAHAPHGSARLGCHKT